MLKQYLKKNLKKNQINFFLENNIIICQFFYNSTKNILYKNFLYDILSNIKKTKQINSVILNKKILKGMSKIYNNVEGNLIFFFFDKIDRNLIEYLNNLNIFKCIFFKYNNILLKNKYNITNFFYKKETLIIKFISNFSLIVHSLKLLLFFKKNINEN